MANKIVPPGHGPYSRRADVLHNALALLIQKEYGKTTVAAKRGSDQNLVFTWLLPEGVTVVMRKSAGNGDPTVWVNRADPTGRTDPNGDWKNVPCERTRKDQTYDLDAILETSKLAVEYNRNHMTEDVENKKVMAEELKGVPMPGGVKVQRDPKSGLYTIRQELAFKGIKLEDAKRVLVQCSKISVAPAEQPPATPPK